MKWVLIIVFRFTDSDDGITSQQIAIEDKASCIAAARSFIQMEKEKDICTYTHSHSTVFCLSSKGEIVYHD